MPSIEILLNVALIWSVAVITPGPNLIITMQSAISSDIYRSALVVLGVATGTAIWAVFGLLGISLLLATFSWIYIPLKIAGGSYLLYLGIQRIKNSNHANLESKNISTKAKKPFDYFKLGLFTNLSNPKTMLFIYTLFAVTIPKETSITTGIYTILLMFTISLCWYGAVAKVFSKEFFQKQYQKMLKWIERLFGTIFLLFGLNVLLSKSE